MRPDRRLCGSMNANIGPPDFRIFSTSALVRPFVHHSAWKRSTRLIDLRERSGTDEEPADSCHVKRRSQCLLKRLSETECEALAWSLAVCRQSLQVEKLLF